MIVLYFFLWTLMLYWIHRMCHRIPFIRQVHLHHHGYVLVNQTKWHWNNLLLFNDDYTSTLDLWITEVIPTIVFSYLTGQYWLFAFYYLWAALVQESIEHNENIDFPLLTSGKWHLLHHKYEKNYSLFIPLWDIIFGTYRHVHK